MTKEELDKLYWHLLTEHLISATPVEQVYFARWTSYSDVYLENNILKWMANRSETDVVAALTIYYQMSPDYYAGKALDELSASEIETVDFLEKISKNVEDCFYTESEIAFKGSDFLDYSYDFKSAKRAIPIHMQKERAGAIELPYDLPEGFDDGLPNHVSVKVWSLFNSYKPEEATNSTL